MALMTKFLTHETKARLAFFDEIAHSAGQNGQEKLTHGFFYKLEDGCIYVPTVMLRTSLERDKIIEENPNNPVVKRYLESCIHLSAAKTDIRQYQQRKDKKPFCVFFAIHGMANADLNDINGMLCAMYFYNGWKAVIITGTKNAVVPDIIQDVLRFLNMRYAQVWTEWGMEHGYKENTLQTSRINANFIVSGLSNFPEEARDFSKGLMTKKRVFDVFCKKFRDDKLNYEHF